jgi:hypothetical protein
MVDSLRGFHLIYENKSVENENSFWLFSFWQMMDGSEKNGGLTIFTKFINSKYVYFNFTLNLLNVIDYFGHDESDNNNQSDFT